MKNFYDSLENTFLTDRYEYKDGKFYFIQTDKQEITQDSFDKVKLIFKRFPRLYYFLIEIISPVYSSKKPFKKFMEISSGIILNLGSGNELRRNNITNIDMMDYDNVDIICNIEQLPFKDSSIDSIMNIAVLEHVANPSKVLHEIYRVLKPGGILFSVIPFMQPYHALFFIGNGHFPVEIPLPFVTRQRAYKGGRQKFAWRIRHRENPFGHGDAGDPGRNIAGSIRSAVRGHIR